MIRTFTYLALPLIEVSHVFDIPAKSKDFYEEKQKEILKIIQHDLISKEKIKESNIQKEDIKIEIENDKSISIDQFSDNYLKIYESLQNLNIEKINLRLISSSTVFLPKSEEKTKLKMKFEQSSSFINLLKSDTQINSKKGCIHFHMHG